MVKLKPCPFCGKTPVRSWIIHASGEKQWYIYCDNQDCPIQPTTPAYTNKGSDIKAWNKRKE